MSFLQILDRKLQGDAELLGAAVVAWQMQLGLAYLLAVWNDLFVLHLAASEEQERAADIVGALWLDLLASFGHVGALLKGLGS